MDGRNFVLKYLTWPHSLWISFLSGLLVAWIGTINFDGIDSLLSEEGRRVMILSWGFLCATGATLDFPNYDPEGQKKTAILRKRIRHLFTAIFCCLMTYAHFFLHPTSGN